MREPADRPDVLEEHDGSSFDPSSAASRTDDPPRRGRWSPDASNGSARPGRRSSFEPAGAERRTYPDGPACRGVAPKDAVRADPPPCSANGGCDSQRRVAGRSASPDGPANGGGTDATRDHEGSPAGSSCAVREAPRWPSLRSAPSSPPVRSPARLPRGTQLVPPARQEHPDEAPPLSRSRSPPTRRSRPGHAPGLQLGRLHVQEGPQAFEDEYDVTVEWTTFNNMEEGIAKMSTGQIAADVFFPTVDYLARLVEAQLLLPAEPRADPQHGAATSGPSSSIPSTTRAGGTPSRTCSTPRASRTAATTSTTRRWPRRATTCCGTPRTEGRPGFYDSYRDALGMALLRRGVTDVNTGDASDHARRRTTSSRCSRSPNAQITINGVYGEAGGGRDLGRTNRGRATSSAPSATCRRASRADVLGLLVPAGSRGCVLQRPDRDPVDIAEPAARPRVPQLLPG